MISQLSLQNNLCKSFT
eukprot:UN09311